MRDTTLDCRAIELARSLGIENVFQEPMADSIYKSKFDLITLIDLIEHPLNPMELLRKFSELLNSKGLLMIWTPNGEFAYPESCPTTFRVDLEHMQYLTTGSCLFIASELKLHIVHLETLGFPSLDGIENNMSTLKNRTQMQSLKGAIRSIPGLSHLIALRRRWSAAKPDERSGAYHLFCIMQKAF